MNLGRIAIVASGNYNPELSYKKLDFVTYNESSYVAKEEILIGEQPGVSSKWQLACKKGDVGQAGLSAYQIWIQAGNNGTISEFLASLNSMKILNTLQSDFVVSTTAVAQVPSFALPIEAGKRYKLKCFLKASTVATTTGVRMQFGLLSGGATVFGFIQGHLTHLASATSLRVQVLALDTIITNNTQLATTGTGGVGIPVLIEGQVIVNCNTTGEIGVYFGSEIASSAATLINGSFIEIEEF